MLTNRKYTLLAALIMCGIFFGLPNWANAQCEPGETAYQITLSEASGTFIPEDIAWEITSNSTGEVVISESCPDYAGGTFDFCLIPGETYTF
ncbi:MAG: hypothetical protein WBG42_17015, partial [Cryomorphaceae bacterium]